MRLGSLRALMTAAFYPARPLRCLLSSKPSVNGHAATHSLVSRSLSLPPRILGVWGPGQDLRYPLLAGHGPAPAHGGDAAGRRREAKLVPGAMMVGGSLFGHTNTYRRRVS